MISLTPHVPGRQSNTVSAEACFYPCGPRPFLQALVGGLSDAGIDRKHILFGPTDEQISA